MAAGQILSYKLHNYNNLKLDKIEILSSFGAIMAFSFHFPGSLLWSGGSPPGRLLVGAGVAQNFPEEVRCMREINILFSLY